jgi:N-acetyl-gamma-glutamyl-phosphate reductase
LARTLARTGVFGATGYTGRELTRWLRRHPRVEVAFETGSASGFLPHEEGVLQHAHVYFLALPHGRSADYAARLRNAQPQSLIIDLSADLRIKSPAEHERWYGHPQKQPTLSSSAVFGLSEVARTELRGAKIVANPGCYATSALLPLAPLLRDRLIEPDDIVIDSKSGASGAGRALREDLLFCEVNESFSAYAPGRAHRHIGEIEETLERVAGVRPTVIFTPHLLPIERGILSAIYVRTREGADGLRASLRRAYGSEPFVRVLDGSALPRLRDVTHTNECHIAVVGIEGTHGRAIVFSALDNLVKGAAGQAIQNMNIALGFDETEALR